MGEAPERARALHREILAGLVERADGSYQIEELVRTGGVVLGVRVPEIRELAAQVARRHQDLAVGDVVAYLDLAFRRRGREEILAGLFLLARFRRLPGSLWSSIDRWIHRIDNWETCDQLALIAGGLVASNLSLVDDLVAWARSSELWRRRFAAAVTTDLNHKGRSHPEATFRILEPLLGDPEAMVRKAVGWALREVSKQAPGDTFDFLAARLDRCAPGVVREGSRKLPDELRRRLLAASP